MVFLVKCGMLIFEWVVCWFVGLQNDLEICKFVGVVIVCEQVMDLVDCGIIDFYFYIMNCVDLIYVICYMFGMG